MAVEFTHQHQPRPSLMLSPSRQKYSTEPLANAVHGIDRPFACGGTLKLKKPPTLRFRDGQEVTLRSWKLQYPPSEELAALITRCSPAPFGKGKKTLRDRAVRDALQLNAADGAFTVADFDPARDGLLSTIQQALCPNDPNPLTAELYGVNVYADRGHFVPHKDTPRGDDMLGTLVVCLPSGFSNGNLVLSHRGAHQVFDWAVDRRTERDPGAVPWAAFFGDVDHSITEVWSGHRVTVSYVLRRGKGAPEKSAAPFPTTERLHRALVEALASPDFLPEGGTLAIPCSHMYSQPGRAGVVALVEQTARGLKGRDADVALGLLRAGLEPHLTPFLFESCADETWRLGEFPQAAHKRRFGRQVTPYEIEETLPVVARGMDDQELGLTWVTPRPQVNGPVKPRRHREGEDPVGAVVELFHTCEYSATGYFGNEGGEVNFYAYAALLTEVPAFGTGPRKEEAARSEKPRRRTRAPKRS